jgi:hypothetical protein
MILTYIIESNFARRVSSRFTPLVTIIHTTWSLRWVREKTYFVAPISHGIFDFSRLLQSALRKLKRLKVFEYNGILLALDLIMVFLSNSVPYLQSLPFTRNETIAFVQ